MLFDRKLLILSTAALAGLGLLMVYSASITPRPSFADQMFLTRQLLSLLFGVLVAHVASRLSPDFWRTASVPLLAASAVLLVAVLLPGIGSRINGAHRWFRIGPVSIQPSEFAKFAQVLFLARAIERKGEQVRRFWRGWLPLLVPSFAISGLVLIEPDFGTAMFLMSSAVLLVFLAGVPAWHLVLAGGVAVPAVGALVLAQPYRIRRMLEFAQAWTDPAAASYHVQQSLVAIGSGGIWGAGLGQGWQKLGFLPEANSDFIFAVVGEELGLVGSLTVLVLWGAFLICGMRLARTVATDTFAYLASFGLVAQLVFQALINVAVVTATLPPKGISLPFISLGGSNLVVSLVSVGVVLGLTREGWLGHDT